MSETYEIKEEKEVVILLAVSTDEQDDTLAALDELEELATTAGAQTVSRVIQNREKVHPGTYLGKGKIEEVAEQILQFSATGVICDDELSPAQLKNLEQMLHIKVMDRTMLILDIFAQRASTKEGKIQVELAQLKYRSSRLVGMRNSLSRLGGGIGTRGPGEKKLEMDRRLIKDRISQLNRELFEVKKNRDVARSLRTKNKMPVAAIVGYTNAGKSSLLNYLTGAGVLEEDKLFATLDPTTRNFELPDGQQLLLTDTVGFIRKLPHHLIEAFRSTLEEAKYADMILHVVDTANLEYDRQMHIVYETLQRLSVGDKTVITIFNKQDLLEQPEIRKDLKADYVVKLSVKTGNGMEDLLHVLEEVLKKRSIFLEKVFSYEQAGKIQQIRKLGQLIEEEYREEGIYVKAYVPKELYEILSVL